MTKLLPTPGALYGNLWAWHGYLPAPRAAQAAKPGFTVLESLGSRVELHADQDRSGEAGLSCEQATKAQVKGRPLSN